MEITIVTGKEDDPFLREIYFAGYTHFKIDYIGYVITLFDVNRNYSKEIDIFQYRYVKRNCYVLHGTKLSGKTHSWICETDGSAKRFRDLIQKEI